MQILFTNINPRTDGGGRVSDPPEVFRRQRNKRWRVAPWRLAKLFLDPFFTHFLAFWRTSKDHVLVHLEWPHPKLSFFKARHHAKETVVDRMTCSLQLAMRVCLWISTTCISRIFFLYRWPEVRSFSSPSHQKAMGENYLPLKRVRFVQIIHKHDI